MQQTSLEQIIEFAKKTGDRLVIFDKNNSSAFVILDLKDYEKLVLSKDDIKDLTEDELLNKINRDIAIWRDSQKEEEIEEKFSLIDDDIDDDLEVLPEDRYYFEPLEE